MYKVFDEMFKLSKSACKQTVPEPCPYSTVVHTPLMHACALTREAVAQLRKTQKIS